MTKNSAYLVCHEHVNEMKQFLSQFFEEEITEFSHPNWVTFIIPPSFKLNLMKGLDQSLTQNFVLEIECDTKEQLEEYAKKHDKEIIHFVVKEVKPNYDFYYVEIPGPHNICKIDVSFH